METGPGTHLVILLGTRFIKNRTVQYSTEQYSTVLSLVLRAWFPEKQ